MLTQERAEKLSGILTADVERAQALLKLEASEALSQINALGNDFTLDELRDYGKALEAATAQEGEFGELDANALDNVAGGYWQILVGIAGAAAAICKAGYQVGKDWANSYN